MKSFKKTVRILWSLFIGIASVYMSAYIHSLSPEGVWWDLPTDLMCLAMAFSGFIIGVGSALSIYINE